MPLSSAIRLSGIEAHRAADISNSGESQLNLNRSLGNQWGTCRSGNCGLSEDQHSHLWGFDHVRVEKSRT